MGGPSQGGRGGAAVVETAKSGTATTTLRSLGSRRTALTPTGVRVPITSPPRRAGGRVVGVAVELADDVEQVRGGDLTPNRSLGRRPRRRARQHPAQTPRRGIEFCTRRNWASDSPTSSATKRAAL